MSYSEEQPRPSEAQAAPTMTAVERLRTLGSAFPTGLASADAQARLSREGANEVSERRVPPWVSFAGKFWGLSAWMIELIALLSLLLHKHADLAVALGLLLVNAVLSFLQEQGASAAVAALRRRLQVTARALRDGGWHALPARELVPGDIVRVRTGDFVPADVQLLDGELHVDQSALTGESQEQRKGMDALIIASAFGASLIVNDIAKVILITRLWDTQRVAVGNSVAEPVP